MKDVPAGAVGGYKSLGGLGPAPLPSLSEELDAPSAAELFASRNIPFYAEGCIFVLIGMVPPLFLLKSLEKMLRSRFLQESNFQKGVSRSVHMVGGRLNITIRELSLLQQVIQVMVDL